MHAYQRSPQARAMASDRLHFMKHECLPGDLMLMWYLVLPYLFVTDLMPIPLILRRVPAVQPRQVVQRLETSGLGSGGHPDRRDQEHRQHRLARIRERRDVHTAPRRLPPLLERRLYAAEQVDQGETRRAREEVTLVFEQRVGREMLADGQQEDGEVEQRWTLRLGIGVVSSIGLREGDERELVGIPVLVEDRRGRAVVRDLHAVVCFVRKYARERGASARAKGRH